jgi:hypothetical protein
MKGQGIRESPNDQVDLREEARAKGPSKKTEGGKRLEWKHNSPVFVADSQNPHCRSRDLRAMASRDSPLSIYSLPEDEGIGLQVE